MSDLTAPLAFADPTALSDAELGSLLRQLQREEQSISRRRTTLHSRIDFVRAGGFASNDPGSESLADLQATEVELSERRLVVHQQLSELSAERSRRRVQP